MKVNNFVAKHSRTFCRASVQVDRRKAEKAGYAKHKKNLTE